MLKRLSPQFGSIPSGERLARMERSPNFGGGVFHNLEKVTVAASRMDMAKATAKFFMPDAKRTPPRPLPVAQINENALINPIESGATLTWLGHSTVLIEMDGKLLLTDPMFGERASPFAWMGPKRFDGTPALGIDSLPPIDAVILSHDHYDHLDYRSILAIAPKTDRFITPLGVGAHLEGWGVSPEKITELDWWDSVEQAGIKFTATPTHHFTGRGGGDSMATLWAGWMLEGSKRVYFGGDSGYFGGFSEIGKRFGPIDFAMLECGAYNKAWSHIHMLPEQTAQAAIDLGCIQMMPIHWASFSLSIHPWDEPIERLLAAAEQLKMDVATPMLGERLVVGGDAPTHKWWQSQ